MKAIILRVTTMLVLVVGLTAVSAQAQTARKTQKFTVPFQFNVGNKVLPAGEYMVSVDNQTVRLQKNDGKANALALSRRTVSASRSNSSVKLTFRQHGDQVYLSQVWLADGLGRELNKQRKDSDYLAQGSRVVEVRGQAR